MTSSLKNGCLALEVRYTSVLIVHQFSVVVCISQLASSISWLYLREGTVPNEQPSFMAAL
jgi:hypothetical protein